MQAAQAKVQAQYATKLAQVNAEQQQLTGEEKTLKTEEGQLTATAISLSGVYVVGQDIKSGTWHTNGDGGRRVHLVLSRGRHQPAHPTPARRSSLGADPQDPWPLMLATRQRWCAEKPFDTETG
jgi:hypothetical protein